MKFKILIIFILFSYHSAWASNKQKNDIFRKTYVDYNIGYTLRYFEDDWQLQREPGTFTIYLISNYYPKVKVSMWSTLKDKNLSDDTIDEKFHSSIKEFTDLNIKLKEKQEINGLIFKVYDYVFTNGSHCQRSIDYFYSGEKGCVVFMINAPCELSTEAKEKIDLLLKGFSLDGNACRGNKKLRGLKTFGEALMDLCS